MCSQSSIRPTKNRNEVAPITTQPVLVCGTSASSVAITASQIATPPIIAVGRLCQRSVFGLATKPQRGARVRTTGVSAAANANDTIGATMFESLIGIMCLGLLEEKTSLLEVKRQVGTRSLTG